MLALTGLTGRVDRSMMDGSNGFASENTLMGKMQRMEVGDVIVIPSARLNYARSRKSELRRSLGMEFSLEPDTEKKELTITRTA